MSKEEFEAIIDSVRDKLDDTNKALVSEDFLAIKGAFNDLIDLKEDLDKLVEKVKEENEELLKVNGKLYQKIGTEIVDDNKDDIEEMLDDEKEEEIELEEIIDEKGELV